MSAETETSAANNSVVNFDVDYLSADNKEDIILKYIQEKKAIQVKLDEAQREVTKKKSEIYDLKSNISELESELKRVKKENDTLKSSAAKSRPTTAKRGSSLLGKVGNKKAPSKKVSLLTKPVGIIPAPAGESKPSSAENTNNKETKQNESIEERFKMIAENFPELKLSIVLKAEETFKKADINGDGTVDEAELAELLDHQNVMVTNKLVKDVMKEIDKDETGTIDMMEYLWILDRLQQRRSTNLPVEVKNSQACSIQ